MSDRYKKITLLHSNDLHGDFLSENIEEKLVGGVSLLSGYVNKTRQEEKNTLYCIAGDMFRGSVIDSEYKGFSTIKLMNLLAPDVATIGNHEIDYGIGHLLFLEKCAEFPIINANLYIKQNGARLFRPFHIVEIDGMKVLFIGVITEEVMSAAKQDGIVGSLIDTYEAAEEVGKICEAYNTVDIDFTVLLTHIGFEEDKKLAALLKPEWGIDIIIGGHSHTLLDEPEKVNDILIVQAGIGTDQIGRFDITVDTFDNCIESYKWETVEINELTCPEDNRVRKLIDDYKKRTDIKYMRTVCKFNKAFTHPHRNESTELGCAFADILKEATHTDIFILGSAWIKTKSLGPVVSLQDLTNAYGSNSPLFSIKVTGAQLKSMIEFFMAKEPWTDEEITFFQFSKEIKIIYDKSEHKLVEFKYMGSEINPDRIFKVGFMQYYWLNLREKFGISRADIRENGPERIIASSDISLLDEYMTDKGRFNTPDTGRFIIK